MSCGRSRRTERSPRPAAPDFDTRRRPTGLAGRCYSRPLPTTHGLLARESPREVADRQRRRRQSREAGTRPETRTRKRARADTSGWCTPQAAQVPVSGGWDLCTSRESDLMPATVVVGLQWGDEGKGKTTDVLAESVDLVVRYQGGDNAGHTVVLGDEGFKLHLVPSGVLHPHITPVIGNGVVVNPRTLIDEMAMLAERGIDPSRVRVSRAAHVIMPYHIALDGAAEARLASEEIGTTRRGIGPAYADRAWRTGVRMGDLLDPKGLRQKLARVLPERNVMLQETFGQPGFDLDTLVAEAIGWGEQL